MSPSAGSGYPVPAAGSHSWQHDDSDPEPTAETHEMVATHDLLSVPELAARLDIPVLQLDAFRRRVRRHEPELLAAGVMTRAGGRRLLLAARLEEIRELLATKT